ncbi:STAS domain-containing protein [Amycolatopsis sp. OK19-0408]|uniref:STAS domain-containing protein n=1 Tax=Amycolatopsis iheyensis TaxID=2945988 RepID=A0A9X2SQ42_9PSEU|nr:STAS domain-containing protein [Amycolatopsis iheyensis]MCR6490659.1 STAS domain-containing protein [Amycolatopsis iheyensis]
MDHSEYRDVIRPHPEIRLSPSPLRLTTTRQRDAVILTAAGEIDVSTIRFLSDALADAIAQRPPLLVVDLTPATFLACSGLTVLMAAHHLAGARTRFAVVAGSRPSWRPMHLTGVDRLLTVLKQLDDALLNAAPMVVRTVVADAAILVTATGRAQAGSGAELRRELRQACELSRGIVLLDVQPCTLPNAEIVRSVQAAVQDGARHCGVRVLTADESLRAALDAAGITHCVSAGPSR